MPFHQVVMTSFSFITKNSVLMTSGIFLVLKSTLSRRLRTSVIDLLNIVSSLGDLFSSCQLHNSYERYGKLFLRSLIKKKPCYHLPVDIREGYNEKIE